jgi:hypothetical protein
LKFIEGKCYELSHQQLMGIFDLKQWKRNRALKPDELPISELVEQFKAYYMRANRIQEMTWNNTWESTFRQLPRVNH